MKRKLFKCIATAVLLTTVIMACKKEPVDGVKLDQSDLVVAVGKTATLTVTFIPNNANNKKVTWESSDPNIASVDKGIITGVALGQATITVISNDGGRTAKCRVSIRQPIEPEMIKVESGTFTMGCTDSDCSEDCNEEPAHKITLSDFNIAKYPVTQKEWNAIMSNNSVENNFPMVNISYTDVQEFIVRLNMLTEKKYRLATEAEWEYAARGGNKSKGYKYSGSNNIDEVAWYDGNSGFKYHSVGEKLPNELGIYDMSGNVFEWCNDWYDTYTSTQQTNPIGAPTGNYRVFRGGSYYNDAQLARVSSRAFISPNEKLINLGFRLVHP